MGGKKVKSAFELAMEKVAEMPSLDKKEIQKKHEEEYMAEGEAIVQQYLQGALRQKDIEPKIVGYQEDIGRLVKKGILNTIKDLISLGDTNRNKKNFQLLQIIEPAIDTEGIQIELNTMIDEFKQQIQQEYSIMVKVGMDQLKKIGISGDAAIPNLRESEAWKEKFLELQQGYNSKLGVLKNKVTS